MKMFFGGVGAAYRREDGVHEAAGDLRREAAVEVVTLRRHDRPRGSSHGAGQGLGGQRKEE